MATVPMVAIARQTYFGRALNAGDAFDATSEDEAADLVAVNMAHRRKVAAIERPPMVAKVVEATDASSPEEIDDIIGDRSSSSTSTPLTHKEHYSRRDMRAKR